MDPTTYPAEAYPLRCASCAFCRIVLHKDGPDRPWEDPFGGCECAKAPNPEDGPMPYHEPGSAILSRPVAVRPERADPPPPPVVVMIPRFDPQTKHYS